MAIYLDASAAWVASIVIGFIGAELGLIFLIIFWVRSYYRKISRTTQEKLSDGELLKLIARAHSFITVDQLAAISPLSKKEAKARLRHLSMEGALAGLHNNGRTSAVVYQLKCEVPMIKEPLRVDLKALSEQQIIEIIREEIDDYQVTPAQLTVLFDLPILESKKLIKRLVNHALVQVNYSKLFQKIYIIKEPLTLNPPHLKILPEQAANAPRALDSKILDIAIKNDGRITPSLICLKAQISIDQAKLALDHLYDQGAFSLDVDEKNGTIEYWLRDKSLLPKKEIRIDANELKSEKTKVELKDKNNL